jgi:hypothetical protein
VLAVSSEHHEGYEKNQKAYLLSTTLHNYHQKPIRSREKNFELAIVVDANGQWVNEESREGGVYTKKERIKCRRLKSVVDGRKCSREEVYTRESVHKRVTHKRKYRRGSEKV